MLKHGSKYTDEQLIDLIKSGINNNVELGNILGVTESSIRSRRKKLVRQGWSPEHDWVVTIPDGYKVKGTSTYYRVEHEPLYNEDGTPQVDESGRLKTVQIHNPRGQWVKSCEDKERQIELMQGITDRLCDNLPIFPIISALESKDYSDLLAGYPIGDPHIGMKAWADECGENWDLEIAKSVFEKIFTRVITSAPPCKQAFIANLGDLLHCDNKEGVTSRSGHSLDKDGCYAQMLDVVIDVMIYIVLLALQRHETVTLVNSIGNHDDIGSMWIAKLFKRLFANNPRLIVLDTPSPFHYIEFGKVLIGMHHGHTSKMDKLPNIMASDKAEAWGRTQYRYWLTGHIHHDSKKEYPGCMVESFRTLAPKDAYAAWGGWRSGQDTKCIIYHREYGEVERHTVNIAQMINK